MNLELKKNEMLGLECSTICSRDTDVDSRQTEVQKPLKCVYGEERRRSADLIKLLINKFSDYCHMQKFQSRRDI